MRRILFFNYEYPPLGGGAANATEQLLREFAKMDDVIVDLVTSAIGSEYEYIEVGKNVHVHRIPIGKDQGNLNYQTQKELLTYTVEAYKFAKILIAKNSYDLTHSFFALPCGAISLLIKWQYKIPYIVSLRGADVPGYSERFVLIYRFLTPLIRRIWKSARFVVTNSKGLTELAQKSAPQQKFEEIYNGIDTVFYQPSQRTSEDRAKEFRILCAARLSYRKGFHYAIDAMAILAEKYPHVRMIFAGGDGGVMQKLKGQVQALSLQESVEFTGHYTKDQSKETYNDADIFLMPSLNEGMSNNLLEALASGMPVLMTPTGGAEELVNDGENGYLIKMQSGEDIATKATKLIQSTDADFAHMQEASRALAEDMSWERVAHQYVTYYKKISS